MNNQKTNKQQGQISMRQEGIMRVWNCSCETPEIEIDEHKVICINEPKYGLIGCGAELIK